jgi:hypothetical protein
MRFAPGDVRDHIILAKIDHRPSYRRCSALQRRESAKRDITNSIPRLLQVL